MSPESTPLYYRWINERVGEVLGASRSAPLWIHSVDWGLVRQLQACDDWVALDALMADAARGLVAAGAQGLVLCTNTMHRCAPAIEAAAGPVPLLHIVDVLADALVAAGRRRAGLLGTRFTMEGDLYPRMLGERGIEVLVPDDVGRDDVHRVIYDELTGGVVDAGSRLRYREVIADLVARGADCVVLGCTEVTLLVGPDDSPVPTFDTTALHARAAADWALGG